MVGGVKCVEGGAEVSLGGVRCVVGGVRCVVRVVEGCGGRGGGVLKG